MEFQELKEVLNEVKTDLAIKQNTFDELSKKMMDKFKIDTVKAAEKQFEKIKQKIADLEGKKEDLMEKAEELLENYELE